MKQPSYSPVKTIWKGLSLLEILGAKQPVSPSELAKELELSRSNVHRFLATLRELGYVEKTQDLRYRLTFKMFRLGSTVLRRNNLSDIAHPHMAHLAEISEENVNLAVLSDRKVLYLDKIESSHYLKLDRSIGETDPVHCTALGKALLSGLTDQQLDDFLRLIEFVSHTKKTIIDPKILTRAIKNIRKQGYATDLEELSYGIHCIAVPIYDHMNRVTAALSISGPSIRLTRKKIEALRGQIIETSVEISQRLGSTRFHDLGS